MSLLFFLQRGEMKRLTDLTELLQNVDFSHHRSSKDITDRLVKIVQSHGVARVPKEGGRLILALFTVAPPSLLPTLHDAVKQKLPGAPAKVAETYGDVYLKAWKAAEPGGEAKSRLEDAVQDLMHRAVLARREDVPKSLQVRPYHDNNHQTTQYRQLTY